jgi:hypothetical protein
MKKHEIWHPPLNGTIEQCLELIGERSNSDKLGININSQTDHTVTNL